MSHLNTRRTLIATGLLLFVVLMLPTSVFAVKANPKPITVYQPDGTAIETRMVGDERVVFYETPNGYTILQDDAGWWNYADPGSHGQAALRATNFRVGKMDVPPGWAKSVRPKIDAKSFDIPFVQQDDGSIGNLFRSRNGHNAKSSGVSISAALPTPTSVPVLVIPVEFSDNAHTSGPNTPVAGEPDYQPIAGQPNTSATWQTLLGDKTVPGGLNHFYWEASYQQFQWQVVVAQRGAGSGSVVNGGWYTNPNTMAYWGADKKGPGGACNHDGGTAIKALITWAIQQANADVNFAPFDTNNNGSIDDSELMIFVVHAREGQENYGDGCGTNPSDPSNNHIWSHKWNMATSVSVDGKTIPSGHVYAIEPEYSPVFNYATNPWTLTEKYFGVGVYAHEAFHTLGATDIYDTGYDAVPGGEWDLMDSGSYNGAKSGTHPAHMGTSLKQDIKMNADTAANSYGFILDGDVVNVTSVDGVKNIAPLGGGSPTNVLHRMIAPNNTNQWFMIENRAAVGYYEPYLPEHGIVIWHRDLSAAVGNNSYPYETNVMRKGWANTTTGLNSSLAGAAFSIEDNETSFTSTSDPNNKLNNGSASGLKDIRCIGAEASVMSYAYGTVSGSHVGYAGTSVSGGDNDPWIDNNETVSLNVNLTNSSCASATASNVIITLSVAADSEIGAGSVTISPSSRSFASIAAGSTVTAGFNVSLSCSGCGGKRIKFAYTITENGVAKANDSFLRDTNKDYLFFDNADGANPGWSSVSSLNPSACASAVNHGNWTNSTLAGSPYGQSYRTPINPSTGSTYTNPNEVWVSPNITIPSGTVLRGVTFSEAMQLPCSGSSRGRLWVSTDNGSSWTRWDAFYRDGGDLSWENVEVDLSSLQGATQVKLMFGLYTYTCWTTACTGTAGWYLDNIGVVVDQATGAPTNTPPSVSITSPSTGSSFVTGSSVSFTGSATDTQDGNLSSGLSWSSNLNGTIGSGASFSTSSLSVGVHTITASVTDSGSLTGSASITVTITSTPPVNNPPTASFTYNCTNLACTFTDTSTDSDGTIATRSWTFGDSSSSTATNPSHTYATAGTYTVSLTVTDNSGAPGSTSSSVTVTAPAGDTTPPVISNVLSVKTNTKNGTFEIRWTTDEASTTEVIIGSSTYTNTSLVTSHVYSFRGAKGASYTYYVASVDAAGNRAQSGPFVHQN